MEVGTVNGCCALSPIKKLKKTDNYYACLISIENKASNFSTFNEEVLPGVFINVCDENEVAQKKYEPLRKFIAEQTALLNRPVDTKETWQPGDLFCLHIYYYGKEIFEVVEIDPSWTERYQYYSCRRIKSNSRATTPFRLNEGNIVRYFDGY